MIDAYGESYYMRGRETGESLYENYRWLPDLTIPMVRSIIQHLGINKEESICDYGCARGYIVRAFRELGYAAFGNDISAWAIDHADEYVKTFLQHSERPIPADWIIAKDVLEHVDESEVDKVLRYLMRAAARGIFIVVPLADHDGMPYVVPEYELDKTHKIRWTLDTWALRVNEAIKQIQVKPPSVMCSYRVSGIKDNYSQFEKANGFITVRK